MIAPLTVWGPGAAMASNATGVNMYGAALPSLPESMMLSALMSRHKAGLTSGGMVGYSTFFTGYDPSQHGMLRSLSIGRLAGQGVSAMARGLVSAGIGTTAFQDNVLKPLQYTHKYGLSGVLSSVSTKEYDAVYKEYVRAKVNRELPNLRFLNKKQGLGMSTKQLRKEAQRRGQIYAAAQTNVALQGKFAARHKWLAGILGGIGFDELGHAQTKWVEEGGRRFMVSQAGSTGAVMTGRLGKFLGAGAKLSSGLMLASMAATATVDIIGAGYESLVRTNARLQERVGTKHTMSAAYFNRAAATERQRAMMTLNTNQLNPRNQLMGNEASFMHTR